MPVSRNTTYKAPYVLSNRHVSTLVTNLLRYPFGVTYERQRIFTPDGDFLDLDWSRTGGKELVILSHGLESSSRTPYVAGMAKYFTKRGYDALAWNFRSCSGEVNHREFFYHPGQTDDMQLVINEAIRDDRYENIYLIGFSLGGAFTLNYLGRHADEVHPSIRRAIVFSTPTDLGACARHLGQGRQIWYGKSFLYRYKRKMAAKAKLFPDIVDMKPWETIKTLEDFDRAYNVPWFNFRDTQEFYDHIDTMPHLDKIRIPTLIVNAENDPFLPEACFPIAQAEASDYLTLELPAMGGHMGFITFSSKGIYWSETRAEAFIREGM